MKRQQRYWIIGVIILAFLEWIIGVIILAFQALASYGASEASATSYMCNHTGPAFTDIETYVCGYSGPNQLTGITGYSAASENLSDQTLFDSNTTPLHSP
jgi:hypothetical protein